MTLSPPRQCHRAVFDDENGHVLLAQRNAKGGFTVVVTENEILIRDRVPEADTWDLSGIFAGTDDVRAHMESVDDLLADVMRHQGHLGDSAERLRNALDTAFALRLAVERITVYARLTYDQDTTNSDAQALLDETTGIAIRVGESLAWFDPEILEIPEDELNASLATDVLQPYRHVIDDVIRNRPFTRSREIEELLVAVGDIGRTAQESFGALDNADLSYGQVHDDNGELVELTKGRYRLLQESRNRAVRQETHEVFSAAYEKHKHVLASLHAGTVRKDVFYAKARGFSSARARALNANAIDERVYDTLIDVTRAHTGVAGRYLELRRQLLGVDQLELYDYYVPLSQLPTVHYSWSEAIDVVCDGLAAMGDEYVGRMRDGLSTGRWVDVYETKGKRSGAYSWGAYGSHPVILMNWNGTLSDVFTLAHEAGHAMHTHLADAAQSYHDAQYPIFLAEIASTLNEVLLTWHLLGKIPQDDAMARFAILNRFADQIMGTHIRQTMFAEFERETHRIVESAQPLTLQQLNELYGDLYRTYTPGINVDEQAELGWARVPHFYMGFYVFQYATGISAGISLAKQVRDEGASAVERVIRLFKNGGKDYPLPLLKDAGVDLTAPDAIEASMSIFDETVTELETIAQSGAFTNA
jgi:oligoendopeptidase F